MGKIKQTVKRVKTKYRKSKQKRCSKCQRFMQVFMKYFNFTKDEVKIIKDKIYLTDLQEKILDMKLKGNLTEYGMALELGVSESTITYQWKKVKNKILKVI